jgi:hypothetical protein
MHSGSVSYFFYALAILTMIAAVVLAIWIACLDGQNKLYREHRENGENHKDRRHIVQYATWFFLISVASGVLAVAAHQREMHACSPC